VGRGRIGLSPAPGKALALCSTLKQHANSKNENHHSCSYERCFYHAFLPLYRPAQQMIIGAKGLPDQDQRLLGRWTRALGAFTCKMCREAGIRFRLNA
jgi:hypothetical protein